MDQIVQVVSGPDISLTLSVQTESTENLPESVFGEELYLLCGLMIEAAQTDGKICLLYTSPSPRDRG